MALGFLDILKSDTKRKFRGIKFVFTGKALKSFNELKHFLLVLSCLSIII